MTRRERIAAWIALAITNLMLAAWAVIDAAKRITHRKDTR